MIDLYAKLCRTFTGVALFLSLCAASAVAVEAPVNDYPTSARADYVFACMQVNGQTRESLNKCSCSIDIVASLMPFDDYEEVETILSVRQKGGEATDMFFSYAPLREKVNVLRRAQVESELRCF
ncbi:MAG: hypothetical protein C0511_05215 [Hyphomicrobium sp.]|nr:hypothetical protein [Hyphomicrobium sp.]PPC82829.1 MAG: hypothetical protein CTY40_03790 [Hyphomicrobium sp.]